MMNPVFAHPGHGAASGSVLPVVLLVAAGVLLVGGLGALAWRGVKPGAWALLGAGVVAAVLGIVNGGVDDPEEGGLRAEAVQIDVADADLSILAPAAGATVPADEEITVEARLDGSPLADGPEDDGGHLHLAVDGKLVQMPYGDRTDVMLQPGRHTLTIEYVDYLHVPFDPAVEESVEVVAEPQ